MLIFVRTLDISKSSIFTGLPLYAILALSAPYLTLLGPPTLHLWQDGIPMGGTVSVALGTNSDEAYPCWLPPSTREMSQPAKKKMVVLLLVPLVRTSSEQLEIVSPFSLLGSAVGCSFFGSVSLYLVACWHSFQTLSKASTHTTSSVSSFE